MTYKKVSASTDNVFSGNTVTIYGIVLVGGSNAATATLENAAAAGTNDFAKAYSSGANVTDTISWGDQGLTVNYVSVTLTGTSPILYIYYV